MWYMKENRIEEGRFSQHARGLGTVTEGMVRERARQLAQITFVPSLDTLMMPVTPQEYVCLLGWGVFW